MTSRLTPSTAALLVLPPLFWAGNAVVGRALVGHFPPLALSFWRWALAFAILLPFAFRSIRRHRDVIRAHWRVLLAVSFLGVGCYNSLQYLALQTSSPVNATLIGASGPVAGLLIGAAFFQVGVNHRQWIGAALSIAGVVWVIARGELANVLNLQLAIGDLIMLVATVLWSVYTWLLRRHRPPLPMTAFLAVQIGLGALMILPVYLIEFTIVGHAPEATAANLAALAYVVFLPSIVAYYCWDRGVARAGAVLPMYFTNLTPVFAALLATFFLAEPIGTYHLVGGALILYGIHLANRPVA
ncbi:MAG TPA: DMT family transporter [Burkholderiaceae bacterium]|nr:DMT family transporter [Burkholderiaceae bacterium]